MEPVVTHKGGEGTVFNRRGRERNTHRRAAINSNNTTAHGTLREKGAQGEKEELGPALLSARHPSPVPAPAVGADQQVWPPHPPHSQASPRPIPPAQPTVSPTIPSAGSPSAPA